jgi:threonine dehydratase
MPKEKRGRSIAVVSGGNIDRDLLTDILSDRTLDADAVGTASE